MLPNVCFPLFPVVDYQSFCRNYYDEDRHQHLPGGRRWIFRGVVHLILYRIVYKNWSISPYEVANAGDLVHYCLWLFLLYLRVSGQFHIIVGMLHLFGFNLPETHHLYYLASSFTDFWRRINIYWKDFMMKLFFNPMYFRLARARSDSGRWWCRRCRVCPHVALARRAVVLAAGLVPSWTTHTCFWTILAVLVAINSTWEFTHGRRRRRGAIVRAGGAVVVGVKTLATFTVICVLWSFWSSESVGFWLSLLPAATVLLTAIRRSRRRLRRR